MWLDGRIRYNPGVLAYPLWGYGLLLGVATISIFIGLFVRSPLHRWPVGLILLNMFTGRSLFYFTESGLNPVKSLDLFDLGIFTVRVYFVVLFQFRLFNVVPVARNRAIEQMRDGMLVIDTQTRIADLNGAAQELLGVARSKVIGREVAQVLLALSQVTRIYPRTGPRARRDLAGRRALLSSPHLSIGQSARFRLRKADLVLRHLRGKKRHKSNSRITSGHWPCWRSESCWRGTSMTASARCWRRPICRSSQRVNFSPEGI